MALKHIMEYGVRAIYFFFALKSKIQKYKAETNILLTYTEYQNKGQPQIYT